jgi:hypothetical protein
MKYSRKEAIDQSSHRAAGPLVGRTPYGRGWTWCSFLHSPSQYHPPARRAKRKKSESIKERTRQDQSYGEPRYLPISGTHEPLTTAVLELLCYRRPAGLHGLKDPWVWIGIYYQPRSFSDATFWTPLRAAEYMIGYFWSRRPSRIANYYSSLRLHPINQSGFRVQYTRPDQIDKLNKLVVARQLHVHVRIAFEALCTAMASCSSSRAVILILLYQYIRLGWDDTYQYDEGFKRRSMPASFFLGLLGLALPFTKTFNRSWRMHLH